MGGVGRQRRSGWVCLLGQSPVASINLGVLDASGDNGERQRERKSHCWESRSSFSQEMVKSGGVSSFIHQTAMPCLLMTHFQSLIEDIWGIWLMNSKWLMLGLPKSLLLAAGRQGCFEVAPDPRQFTAWQLKAALKRALVSSGCHKSPRFRRRRATGPGGQGAWMGTVFFCCPTKARPRGSQSPSMGLSEGHTGLLSAAFSLVLFWDTLVSSELRVVPEFSAVLSWS